MTGKYIVTNNGGRIAWIDWAKAIGIFLVMLGHMKVLSGKLFIYMFHMAFFFMLSGYLYKPITIRKEIIKSAKSLLVPYLCFNAMLLLISIMVHDFEWSMIENILLCNYELFQVRYFSPLWFLISLFLIRLLCSLFSEENLGWILAFFLVLNAILFYTHSLPLDREADYFQLATTCICIPSFIFGWIVKKRDVLSKIDELNPTFRYCVIAVVLLLMMVLGRYNGRVNVFTCAVGKDIVVYYVVSTVISLILMYLLSKFMIKESIIVRTISTGTILIIGLHVAMIDGLTFGIKMNSVLSILLAFVIMIVCYVLIKISLNFFPFLIGRNNK